MRSAFANIKPKYRQKYHVAEDEVAFERRIIATFRKGYQMNKED